MKNNNFEVIDGTKKEELDANEHCYKCYDCQSKGTSFRNFEEMFNGYNKLQVITFSYNLDMIEKIVRYFDYAEILLGADYIATKDKDLQSFFALVEANSNEANKYPIIKEMLRNGNLIIKAASDIMDHRKMYFLSSDDGKTRIITSSANLSTAAFSGNHEEFYHVFDNDDFYDDMVADFETAFVGAINIPYDCLGVDFRSDSNAFLNHPIVKECKVDALTVVLQENNTQEINRTKFVIDVEKSKKEYDEILKNTNLKPKDGKILLTPENSVNFITRVSSNIKELVKKRIQINEQIKEYPSISFNFGTCQVFLDEKEMDLSPSIEEVKNGIEKFVDVFKDYDDFKGDVQSLKRNCFKILNAIFCSPFQAPVRQMASCCNVGEISMPLFLIITSKTANAGKSFIVKVAIKMMTNENIQGLLANNCDKKYFEGLVASKKGLPIFIDELTNPKFKSSVEGIVKVDTVQFDYQPMLIFAGNGLNEPNEIIRKRCLYIPIKDIAMPSDADPALWAKRGTRKLNNLDNSFYREYLRRILPKVENVIEKIEHNYDNDNWYPDILKISSETIIEIFNDFGYDLPEYVVPLNWRDDYSANAKYVYEEALLKIKEEYENSPQSFNVEKNVVVLYLGSDEQSKNILTTWRDILPAELMAKYRCDRNGIASLTMNRQELENHLGISFETKKEVEVKSKKNGIFRFFKKG